MSTEGIIAHNVSQVGIESLGTLGREPFEHRHPDDFEAEQIGSGDVLGPGDAKKVQFGVVEAADDEADAELVARAGQIERHVAADGATSTLARLAVHANLLARARRQDKVAQNWCGGRAVSAGRGAVRNHSRIRHDLEHVVRSGRRRDDESLCDCAFACRLDQRARGGGKDAVCDVSDRVDRDERGDAARRRSLLLVHYKALVWSSGLT